MYCMCNETLVAKVISLTCSQGPCRSSCALCNGWADNLDCSTRRTCTLSIGSGIQLSFRNLSKCQASNWQPRADNYLDTFRHRIYSHFANLHTLLRQRWQVHSCQPSHNPQLTKLGYIKVTFDGHQAWLYQSYMYLWRTLFPTCSFRPVGGPKRPSTFDVVISATCMGLASRYVWTDLLGILVYICIP